MSTLPFSFNHHINLYYPLHPSHFSPLSLSLLLFFSLFCNTQLSFSSKQPKMATTPNSATTKKWFTKRSISETTHFLSPLNQPKTATTTTTTRTNSATKKKWSAKRLMSKEAWRWRVLSSGFRFPWKRLHMIKLSFLHDFLFKIVSTFEAIFLVSSLCFFFLCCGCHF